MSRRDSVDGFVSIFKLDTDATVGWDWAGHKLLARVEQGEALRDGVGTFG